MPPLVGDWVLARDKKGSPGLRGYRLPWRRSCRRAWAPGPRWWWWRTDGGEVKAGRVKKGLYAGRSLPDSEEEDGLPRCRKENAEAGDPAGWRLSKGDATDKCSSTSVEAGAKGMEISGPSDAEIIPANDSVSVPSASPCTLKGLAGGPGGGPTGAGLRMVGSRGEPACPDPDPPG